MEPSTLDTRQKDLVSLSFCRGSRVEGSLSRARVTIFFQFFFYKNRNVLSLFLFCFLIKIVRGHSNSLKSKDLACEGRQVEPKKIS